MSDRSALPSGLQLTALDPTFRDHPHDVLDRLRDVAPVHDDQAFGRVFLTRFADVNAVLADRRLSVDPRKAAPGSHLHRTYVGAGAAAPFEPSMLQLDDPDHRRLRSLTTKAFNQRTIEAMRPRIRAIAGALLDTLASRDGFDVIAAYAAPLPIIVIAEMLGVDAADMAQFKAWSDDRAQGFNPARTEAETAALRAAQDGINGYIARAAAERRERRGNDLISALVAAEEAGEHLTLREIVTTCHLLLVAGNLTTTDLIGNGVHALLRHPDQLALLRDRPALAANAVEEILRLDPPVAQTARATTEPVAIGGVDIAAGQSLTASLLAAGHDPARHADPHRFDIARRDTGHLAFGGGAHFCLGAPLARAEAQIALPLLFERFPALRFDPERPAQRKSLPVFNGWRELWVRTDTP
jgi:cytochrome P450